MDILYALAEGTYLYGSKLARSVQVEEQDLAPDYFMLSALYSWYFVRAERANQSLNIFDNRVRAAIDMYNFGLWQAFETGGTEELVLKTAERQLPFGSISISLDTSQFPWKIEEFEKFLPADRYAVRGVSVRNRVAGIGVPMIAIREESGQAVPATAILRVEGDLAALNAKAERAALELYSTKDTGTVQSKDGIAIPIESDLTTSIGLPAGRFQRF